MFTYPALSPSRPEAEAALSVYPRFPALDARLEAKRLLPRFGCKDERHATESGWRKDPCRELRTPLSDAPSAIRTLDLNRLKIDRGTNPGRRSASRSARRGVSPWVPRAVLLAVAIAALWLFYPTMAAWIDRVRLPEVEAVKVVRRSPAAAGAVSGAAANGYIVPRTRAALSADTPGTIVELNVREGQAIEKDFVVARLYDEEYEAALRRAEADVKAAGATLKRSEAELAAAEAALTQLEESRKAAAALLDEALADEALAKLNHERAARLVKDGVDTPQKLDEATASLEVARSRTSSARANVAGADALLAKGRADVDLARAAVEEARAQVGVREAVRDQAAATLRKTEVRAPFSGIVILKDAEVGEVVSPNSQAGSNARGSIVTMVDFASLEAQAEVPETTLSAVEVGAPVRIYLDAFPNHPYRGRVDRIWPTANRQKATIEVRAVFENPDDRLRPEMGVRVVFLDAETTETEDAAGELDDVILIPEDAVVRVEGETAVFVLERDVARLRRVEIGERLSDRLSVKSGLAEDETVIRRPPASLEDGDRVRRGG